MKVSQLESELAQLNQVKGKLQREQRTYKKWIEELLNQKSDDEVVSTRTFTSEPLWADEYSKRSPLLSTHAIREQYMRGIAELTNVAQKTVNEDGTRDWSEASDALSMLEKQLQGIMWAESLGPNNVRVMESGNNVRTVFCVIAPNHPEVHSMQNPLHAVEDNGYFVVKVKPVQMKPLWSALSSTHELRHITRMQDRSFDITNPDSYAEEERLALRTEYVLLNAFTAGELDRHLDAAIAAHGIRYWKDLFDFERIPPHRLAQELDKLLLQPKPMSHEEGGIRTALYMSAMAFRFNERAADPETRRSMDHAFAKQLYKPNIDKHPF